LKEGNDSKHLKRQVKGIHNFGWLSQKRKKKKPMAKSGNPGGTGRGRYCGPFGVG